MGGVGVSGGSAEEDLSCARAAHAVFSSMTEAPAAG